MNKEENKKTHVQQFLDTCTDEEIILILKYVKAQLEDDLEKRLTRQEQ